MRFSGIKTVSSFEVQGETRASNERSRARRRARVSETDSMSWHPKCLASPKERRHERNNEEDGEAGGGQWKSHSRRRRSHAGVNWTQQEM